jgi:hypothetical protein
MNWGRCGGQAYKEEKSNTCPITVKGWLEIKSCDEYERYQRERERERERETRNPRGNVLACVCSSSTVVFYRGHKAEVRELLPDELLVAAHTTMATKIGSYIRARSYLVEGKGTASESSVWIRCDGGGARGDGRRAMALETSDDGGVG